MKLVNLHALLPAILLGACSQLPSPAMQSHNLSGSHVYSAGPSLSNFLVQDANIPRKFCADRGADAAFEFSEDGNVSLSLISIGKSDGEKSGLKENSGEQEMVGRTPAVLITRELLYRACELSVNFSLTKEEAISLFNGARATIEKGWSGETAKTTITIGDSLTNKNSDSFAESDASSTQSTTNTTRSATTSSSDSATKTSSGSATSNTSGGDASAGGGDPSAGGGGAAPGGGDPSAGGGGAAPDGGDPSAGGGGAAPGGGGDPSAGGGDPSAGGGDPSAGGGDPSAGGGDPSAGGG